VSSLQGLVKVPYDQDPGTLRYTKKELSLSGFETSELRDSRMLKPHNIQIDSKVTCQHGNQMVGLAIGGLLPFFMELFPSLNFDKLFSLEVTQVVDLRTFKIFPNCWIYTTIKFDVDLLQEWNGVKQLESPNVEVAK